MKLFNHYNTGSEEVVNAVGLIGRSLAFDKWEPIIPLATREVAAIVGDAAIDALDDFYRSPSCDALMERAVYQAQQAIAFFAWLRIIPTLDAQHDAAGRSRRLGENEKGLTALQEFKDEENIRRLAYEAVDALISTLEKGRMPFWLESKQCTRRAGLLLRSKDDFDRYYTIGSHRLYLTLLPMIEEVQSTEVEPLLSGDMLAAVLSDCAAPDVVRLRSLAARATALLAIRKAVQRLPVEVLPDGIVQVQQSVPVRSKLRAEKEARESVAAALAADAAAALSRVEALVAEMTTGQAPAYIAKPHAHTRGFSF